MMLSIVSGDAMFPTRVNYINFSPNIPTLSYVVCKVVYRAIFFFKASISDIGKCVMECVKSR